MRLRAARLFDARRTSLMPNLDSQTILIAILAVVAFAILVQTILLLAFFLIVRRSVRAVQREYEGLRDEVLPIVHNVRELVARVAPHIENTASDVAALVHGLRAQTADLQAAASDVLGRFHRQVVRIDAMVSAVFHAVDRASGFVSSAVAKPVQQFSHILTSVKAVIDSLRKKSAPAAPASDDEIFS
jgi:uncharacterized protein YoxC